MPKPSWSGAATGAATGAALGSAVPVIGTGLGALGGGLLGLFGGNAGKKSEKTKQLPTQTKEQQQLAKLINAGLVSGKGPFAELFGDFNQEKFDQGVTQPALKNFQENILPQLQEKFIAGNQVLGSGMRNAQVKAATDLQSQLAALMYQAQQQQQQNKLAGIQSALGNRGVENVTKGGTKGAGESFLQGLTPELGKVLGGWIANKGGASTTTPSSTNTSTPETTVG